MGVPGVFELTLKGSSQERYRVETSVDLASWASIASLSITNEDGSAVFHYPSQPNDAQRFFRAVQE